MIALASPRVAQTLEDGLERIQRLQSEASTRGAEIVCFPEAYLPGLRGQDFDVLPWDAETQERALRAVAGWAKAYGIATILGSMAAGCECEFEGNVPVTPDDLRRKIDAVERHATYS